MTRHVVLQAAVLILLSAFWKPACAQDPYSIVSLESGDEATTSSHQVTIPSVESSNLGLYWTLTPPMVEIQGLVQIETPLGMVKEVIPANLETKFDVSGSGNGFSIAGKNNRKRIDETWAGISGTAVGKWTTTATTVTGTSVTYVTTEIYTAARINPFDPTSEEWVADAFAIVLDPITIPALPLGEEIELETILHAGQTLQAMGQGVGVKHVFAGTDIPGFERLYELNIDVREANGTPMLAAEFLSNPLLGLDDAAVAGSVLDAFTFDTAQEHYVLESDVTLFNGPLPLPSGGVFNLYLDESASADVGDAIDPPPASDTVILSPTAVLGTDLGIFSGDVPVENMIDQSGLDTSFISGETSFDEYLAGQPLANSHFSNNWQSDVSFDGQMMGSIDFDLGDTYDVDRLAVWNGTLEDVTVSVADSPEGPWQEVGDFTLENYTPTLYAVFEPEILELDATVDARYIRLTVESVYPFLVNDTFAYAVVGEVAASVLSPATTVLVGDYNGNALVEQGDLDFVLSHWGEDATTPPDGWINDLPSGVIDQDELDRVLANWGNSAAGEIGSAGSVPEPLTFGIAVMAVLIGALLQRCLPRESHVPGVPEADQGHS